MASACQAPPRPQSSVTVPVGGDASKKRALSGPLRPPPDVHMNDAEAEAIAHQLAPDCTPAFNPDNMIPGLISFVSGTLGCASNSVSPSGSYLDPLLVQLALAKKLEDIHATILSVKAKADHAQQVASSVLNMASAAASASRTYAQTAAAAVPLKPPPSQTPDPLAKPHQPLLLLPPPPPVPEGRSLLQLLPPPPRSRPARRPSADSSPPLGPRKKSRMAPRSSKYSRLS